MSCFFLIIIQDVVNDKSVKKVFEILRISCFCVINHTGEGFEGIISQGVFSVDDLVVLYMK